jgi:hypothetical protein
MSTNYRNVNGNDPRHRRHTQTKGTEPVYLSRAQRIWLARHLGEYSDQIKHADLPVPESFVRDEVKMAGSVRARLREARTDG